MNIIHDVRNDPVINVSSQEPSMSSKYPPSWPPIPDTLPIEISTPNFQGMLLMVKEHHSWHQKWPSDPCLRSGTFNVSKVPPFLTPPSWHTSNWDINTKFSGYLPWGKKHHSWCQEWLCPPCLWSGTLNVLQVPPFLTPPSWHTSDWDINTKFSGYVPWGEKTSFMTSWMTLSSMSPIRNPQRPLSTPLLDPPHSWHTYNWDINTKFSGYLPWDKKTSFMTTGMTMSSMGLVRNPQPPPSTPLLDPPFLTHL